MPPHQATQPAIVDYGLQMCLASVEYGELHGVCTAIGMAVDKNTELLQGPEWRAEAGARCAMMM
jgi:hypothetical protein